MRLSVVKPDPISVVELGQVPVDLSEGIGRKIQRLRRGLFGGCTQLATSKKFPSPGGGIMLVRAAAVRFRASTSGRIRLDTVSAWCAEHDKLHAPPYVGLDVIGHTVTPRRPMPSLMAGQACLLGKTDMYLYCGHDSTNYYLETTPLLPDRECLDIWWFLVYEKIADLR